MSVVAKSLFEQVFDEALRDAEGWTYRSSVGFDPGDTVTNVRKAYKLGDVRDVFVERDKFETSTLSMFRSVKVGAVSRIVAGTGTGKSTKMPISLVLSLDCVSFVVCPTNAMAGSLANYVKEFVVGTKYEVCQIALVKTYSNFAQLKKPAVAYMGANEFLAMLSMHQGLFQERSVGFVYLDESHERIPAYAVCRLLVSMGVFKDTKVFMGSATASSQNMEARGEGVKQVIRSVKPEYMQYDDIQNITKKSPLCHVNLALRTLVFVPSEKQFSALYDYYESNAVHVRLLKYTARHSEVAELNLFLETVAYTVVVLATPAHQTGYTFAVDAVVDCGVTPYLYINSANGDMEKRDRVVTEFERVQRAGRVGRFLDGVAYQVDAEPADEGFELYAGSEIYVVLWCKVFSIDVSISYLKSWSVMLKDLSVACAKNLLCSRLHPALMLHYMDSEGRAYAGTRHMFGKLLGRTEAVLSSNKKLSDDILQGWVTKVMTADSLGELAGEFKAPCQMPGDWLPIACVMYHALMGVSVTSLFSDGKIQRRDLSGVSDSGSVVSYALSASSVGSGQSGSFLDPNVQARFENYGRAGAITPEDSVSVVAAQSLRPVTANIARERSDSRSSTASRGNASIRLTVRDNGKARESFDSQRDSRPSSRGSGGGYRRETGSKRSSMASSYDSRDERADLQRSVSSNTTVTVDKNQVNDAVATAFDKQMKKVNAAFSDLRRPSVDGVGSSKAVVVPVATRYVQPEPKIHIKPAKLSFERVRPYRESYMESFRAMRVSRAYVVPYERIVSRSVTIGNMAKDVMVDHFLATVISWNITVSELFQFRAVPHTGLLAEMRNKRAFDKFESELNTCRGVLELFYHHGLKLALYHGVEQSGIAESTVDLMRAQAAGEYAQRIGNHSAIDAVERVKYCVRMSNEFGGVSGHYYVDGNIMLLVKHVFNEVDGDGTYMIFPRTDVASMRMLCDRRVFKCKLTINSAVRLRYRLPRLGETVVVVAILQRDLPDVFGVYTVTALGESGVYDAVLADGMSGAPLVALSDGAVVGLHHGRFVDGEHQGSSEFVSVV